MIQLMCLLSGDLVGARNCGLIKTKSRQDIHRNILGDLVSNDPTVAYSRKYIKEVAMTVMYGSQAIPKLRLTKSEIPVFYDSVEARLPVSINLLNELLKSHSKTATNYSWTLPDGHKANVNVLNTFTYTIDLDELENIPFTHRISEVSPKDHDVANCANIIQSLDAFIVRELNLRCQYNKEKLESFVTAVHKKNYPATEYKGYLSVANLSMNQPINKLVALQELCIKLLNYPSFEQYSVHDKYFCSPIHMNYLRVYLRDIYAELADSNLAQEILTEVQGYPSTFTKLSNTLPELIRNSEYIIS